MNTNSEQLTLITGTINKLILGIAIASIILLTPFAINNFIQDRILLGLASALIIVIFATSAWNIARYKRYQPNLLLYGLIPCTLILIAMSILTQGIIGILWTYPAILLFYFILPERKAWLANILLILVVIPSVLVTFDNKLSIRILVTLISVSLFSAIFINVVTRQQEKLKIMAITDPLTGLLNRTLLSETLTQASYQYHRSGNPMTLIVFDIDHFKRVNDNLGHDAGDSILQAVAHILKQRCRKVDKVFRLGGEEFLLFLYNTDLGNAKHVADEIRRVIENSEFLPNLHITISAGIASLRKNEEWKSWFKRGDDHLLHAKKIGRNTIADSAAQDNSH